MLITLRAYRLIGHFQDDDISLQLPELISSLLSYLNLSIPLKIRLRFNQQLLNEAECLMKSYGDRGESYPSRP